MSTIIVGAVLLLVVICIIYKMIKGRKDNPGCCGGCSGCNRKDCS